jgi:hypothetical protein
LAAGRVVSTIQRVWSKHAGTDKGYEAEAVMRRAEALLDAIRQGNPNSVLTDLNARDFIGADWIAKHSSTERAMRQLEAALRR